MLDREFITVTRQFVNSLFNVAYLDVIFFLQMHRLKPYLLKLFLNWDMQTAISEFRLLLWMEKCQ